MIDPEAKQIVGSTVDALIAEYGQSFNVFELPEPHRLVILVDEAHARITNGGFQYLLERPDASIRMCRAMSESHAAIDSIDGHRAFTRFLRGVLWIQPTAKVLRPFNRFRTPLSLAKAMMGFETADTLYWESSDVTYTKLAEYIGANTSAFGDHSSV